MSLLPLLFYLRLTWKWILALSIVCTSSPLGLYILRTSVHSTVDLGERIIVGAGDSLPCCPLPLPPSPHILFPLVSSPGPYFLPPKFSPRVLNSSSILKNKSVPFDPSTQICILRFIKELWDWDQGFIWYTISKEVFARHPSMKNKTKNNCCSGGRCGWQEERDSSTLKHNRTWENNTQPETLNNLAVVNW